MSPPSRVVAVALLFAGLVVMASVPVTGSNLSPDGTVSQENPNGLGGDPAVSFAAELQTNGDAQWNITTTVSLDSESDVESYQSTVTDFEDGELPPLGYSAFETGMADVNDQTDREMELTEFRRETATESEIENGVGRYTVEFTWENFLRETDDQLLIDRDVLVMQNGDLWFPGLSDSQTLEITAPSGYGVRDSTVPARNGQLLWEGPETFDETSLQATFLGTGSGSNIDSDGPELTDRSGVFPWLFVPIIAIGIAVAVFLSRTEQIQLELPTNLDVTDALSTSATGRAAEKDTVAGETDSADEPTVDEPGDGSDNEIDTELLSDEERVERLLSSNGGRMKQADIVKETDWSNAKVSQLLSAMEEEDRIDKLRIGRENLISFPDEEITDSDE